MSLPESESPLLDLSNLKFQPAWVNESSDFSNYAGAPNTEEKRSRHERRPREEREGRPPRPPGARGGQRDRRDSDPRRRDDSRAPSRGAARADSSRRPRGELSARGPREHRRPGGPQRPAREETPPPPIKVEFLPDEAVLSALATQIRASHLTYPLFGLAKKFLEKPEYHQVRLSIDAPNDAPAPTLYRVGDDGAVTLDRRAAERIAFERNRGRFYEEKTEQGEPPKGNFTNVARCRLDGTLLGPTNHHGYQTALRSLYDARYSRRMSFEQFRREIEVVSDAAEVEKWKEQSRAVTTFTVIGSEPPVLLKSLAEVRQHFEENHLNSILQSAPSFVLAGPAARANPDSALSRAMRAAWEAESRYPGNLVQHVRAGLQKASLQIFKHRKKFVHVSGVRPTAFKSDPDSAVSESVQSILAAISARPGISRKALAEKILGPAPAATVSAAAGEATAIVAEQTVDAPPAADDSQTKAKAALVNDLHWLITSGHVIAFHDGTFDLPPTPVAKPVAAVTPNGPAAEQPSKAEDEAKEETAVLEAGIQPDANIATPITETPIAH